MSLTNLIRVAVVLVCLAAGALVLDWYDRHRDSNEMLGHSLIGSENLAPAGIVLIETPHGQVTMRRTDWGWELDELDGYAVDMAKLRGLLLRFAHTSVAQRVPVRPGQLGELGLLQKVENQWHFEAGRTASVFSVIHGLEFKHRMIYQVLVGNRRGEGGTYVRFPASNTAYLVAEDLMLDGRPEQWMEHRVFDPDDGAELSEVDIRRAGAAPLAFRRAARDGPWRLAGSRREPRPERVRGLLEALLELRIEQVSPREEDGSEAVGAAPVSTAPARPGADGAPAVEARFSDGRVVTLSFRAPAAPDAPGPDAPGPDGDAPPVAARATARQSDTRQDTPAHWIVVAFNHRFEGRTVGLNAAQSRRLLAGRESYFAPP
jgi:Domain of unknown function (DUF4340)